MSAQVNETVTGKIEHIGSLAEIRITLFQCTLYEHDGEDLWIPPRTRLIPEWPMVWGTA